MHVFRRRETVNLTVDTRWDAQQALEIVLEQFRSAKRLDYAQRIWDTTIAEPA